MATSKREAIQEYTENIKEWTDLMSSYVEREKYDIARDYAENILITIDKLRYIEKKFEV